MSRGAPWDVAGGPGRRCAASPGLGTDDLKVIAEHGPENVNVLLQGNLRPAAAPGGPYELDAAGLNVTPKTPKKEAP